MNGFRQDSFIQLDSLNELQAQFERIRLEFTVTEIDTAWAFARSAETLYGAGSPNADRVSGKAWEAYLEASNQLRTLPLNRKLRDGLNAKLNEIRVMLDALPSNGKRKLRVVRRNGKG